MYKLEFYVPSTHVNIVLDAIFEAGAGKIGNYDCCCFITEGIGQFRPLIGSNPYSGEVNQITKVKEQKIEIVLAEKYVKFVKKALLSAHPYEVPAYQFILINDNL